jgi:hypothetical protein
MHPTDILRLFDEWELRTRGITTSPSRVPIEPSFSPLFPKERTPKPILDDARRPGLLDRLRETFAEPTSGGAAPPPDGSLAANATREVLALELLLPPDLVVKEGAARHWLASLSGLSERLSFELIGLPDRVVVQLVCGVMDCAGVVASMRSFFPEASVRKMSDCLRQVWAQAEGFSAILGFGLKERVFRELRTEGAFDVDPLIGIIGELNRLSEGELGLVQLIVEPTRNPWREEFEQFALSIEDEDHVLSLIRSKFSEPLFAGVLRVAALALDEDRAAQIARSVAHAVSAALRSEANELAMTVPEEDSSPNEVDDLLDRASHRSGMLLSLSEILTLIHPPSSSVRSERLARRKGRTKAAPQSTVGHGLVLGMNEHDGEMRLVSLSKEDRLRHSYIIGASGTGKSTLLLSMATQDIAAGNGFAVLDPHGDLIEDILARVPQERADDVVLFDPADEAFPVAFNILSAHSELERTLLSSDLVAVFKRLSTSFGDQMVAVLGNAILAFLESSEGGTLLDLRRFLIDKSFRAGFLETVQDSQVVSYWQEEFALLKGLPHAPILTRLNTFLRPKLIRRMVAQEDDRLDMRGIMDRKKILLVKLSQGGIGEENGHLLGSLIVAKIAQATMSRQDEAAAARVPFYVYIDEFHHFVTPSLASILSGARKYGLGLTLAHQETRQMKSRSDDVASAVLSNTHTRIVFRVGEQDARALADAFSYFDAADLQNLGVGEAVARIERRDTDFNLRTQTADNVDPTVAAARREACLASSRARYASPRAVVEELLRRQEHDFNSAEDERPKKAPRSKQQPVSGSGIGEKQSSAPPAVPPAAPLPGRGGPRHKYLQSLVGRLAEDKGFKVSVEKAVLGGHGHIDVLLERAGLSIGCEISVTTRVEHEVENLSKCLAAGCDYAVLLSSEEQTLSEARMLFSDVDPSKVRFITPEGLITFLDEIVDGAPSTEHGDKRRTSSARAGKTSNTARPGMLIARDAAAYIGVAQQTLAKMRWSGESPPYFKVGRQVVYDRGDLDSWLALRRRRSTSDPS